MGNPHDDVKVTNSLHGVYSVSNTIPTLTRITCLTWRITQLDQEYFRAVVVTGRSLRAELSRSLFCITTLPNNNLLMTLFLFWRR